MNFPRTGRSYVICLGLLIGMVAASGPIVAEDALQNETTRQPSAVATPAMLVTRSVRAMGGETLISSIENLHSSGAISIQDTPIATIDLKFAVGNRSLIRIAIQSEQLTSITEIGCNGTTAWELERSSDQPGATADRVLLLKPAELNERVKANHWLGRVLQLGSLVDSMRTIGTSDFHGSPSWEIEIQSTTEPARVFFDMKTRLVNGFRLEVDPPLADPSIKAEPIYLDIVFSDWKDVKDIKLFHKVRILQEQQQVSIAYDSIEVNSLKSDDFDLPTEVRSLLEKSKEESAPPQTDRD